jgi:hypothetical protein
MSKEKRALWIFLAACGLSVLAGVVVGVRNADFVSGVKAADLGILLTLAGLILVSVVEGRLKAKQQIVSTG